MLSVACGPGAPTLSLPKIYGGEPVPAGERASAVGIVRAEAAGLRLVCTGVLVTPDVVLTAGHCVDDLPADDLTSLRLYVGDGQDGGLVSASTGIASLHVSPQLRRHPLGYADVAVLRLDAPLAGVQPARLSQSLAEDARLVAVGQPVTLVGYGEREDRARGIKFQVTTDVTRTTSHEFVASGDGRDACQGDSGGPVFAATAKDGERLVGLVSRGTGLGCGDGGYVTRLTDHACWLNAVSGTALFADALLCPSATPAYADTQLAIVDLAALCRDKRLSAAARHTLKVMVAALGAKTCAAAAAIAPTVAALNLDHQHVSDPMPLVSLTGLEQLSLVGNRLTSVQTLRRLPALRTLDITANDVVSDAALPGVTVLGTRRQRTNYADTDFLRLCRDDATPDAARRTIRAIFWKTMAEDCDTANARLLMLTTLNLRERDLTDVTPLAGLQQLTRLDLSKNPLTDVAPLAGLERLTTLDLRSNAAVDLAPLAPLVARGLTILADAP